MDAVNLTINGAALRVPRGSTIREAALTLGIHTPTLCYHPHLHAGSNCRACVVELDGARTLVPSCSREVSEGMAIRTDSDRVRLARKMVFELLMTEVDTSAAPELQAFAQYYQSDPTRYPTTRVHDRPAIIDNPFFARDYAKCIACQRCTQACAEDVQHTFAIAMVGRGHHITVGAGAPGDDLTQSPCVFCGNCVGVCPTGALTGLNELQSPTHHTLTWSPNDGFSAPHAAPTTTTCSFCGVGCTLELHTVDGRIIKATSPDDAVVNRGNLCVKGRFGYDYVHHAGRLTQPFIRRNGRPGARRGTPEYGTLEPASWEEALDLVAARLNAIRATHGPDAIGGFSSAKATNEENYLFQKFIRACIGTHNVDHCSRLCHASSVTAVSMALGSLAMTNSIGEIRGDVDCMLITGSNTTENHPIIALEMKAAIARGAKLILVEPREIELSQFATHHLRQRSGTDIAIFNAMAHVIIAEELWAKEFVDARTEGFTDLAKAVAPCTPEWAEAISGVPADLIRQAARLYATSKASAIYWGMGISQHHNGTDTALTLCNLALLCGQIGRPGTGLNPLRGQNNVQGAGDMGCLPPLLPGYARVAGEGNLARFEQLWGARLSRTRGLTSTELTEAMGEGKVKALYVMGENPMLTDPNLNHARACFEELDFLVVQDIFQTETAAVADVILPATAFAEKEGTFTNTERRVQRVRKAVTAPGEARHDWEIICDVSTRMGFPMHYSHASEILQEIGRCNPDYGGITWERLEAGPGIQYPCPDLSHPGTRFLFPETFPRGRGNLHGVTYEPPTEPADAAYPYILTTGRVLFHWHGGVISRRSEGLDAIAPEALVEIHPRDADALGFGDADRVTVRSRRGQIAAKARLTTRTLPGSIFMTFHYAEAAANLLTIDSLDPLAKIPEFKVCAVTIEKAGEPS